MRSRSTFPNYDRILDGALTQLLTELRADGRSYSDIAHELRDRGVRVDPTTVLRWCRDLGITDQAAAS